MKALEELAKYCEILEDPLKIAIDRCPHSFGFVVEQKVCSNREAFNASKENECYICWMQECLGHDCADK